MGGREGGVQALSQVREVHHGTVTLLSCSCQKESRSEHSRESVGTPAVLGARVQRPLGVTAVAESSSSALP